MDSFNLFINANTPFKKNARAVASKKLQPAFKRFVRENKGFYNDIDLLEQIGKAYNPVSDRIVNRSTVYTKPKGKKGQKKTSRVRAKFEKSVFDAQVSKYDSKLDKLYQKAGEKITFNLKTMTKKAIQALIEKIDTSFPLVAKIQKENGTTTHYALNDKTISRLFDILAGQVEGEKVASDEELLSFIEGGKKLTLTHVAQTKKNSGAFFKYTLCQPLEGLEKFGIFSDVKASNYDDSCFIKALEASGVVSTDEINKIKLTIKTRYLPMCNMRKIAEKFNLHIKVRGFTNTKHVYEFGDKEKPLIDLGLIDQHYFLIATTNYTSYSLKNYETLKDKKRWNEFIKKDERSTKRFINSLELMKLLINNEEVKKTFLKPIKISAQLFETQHFEKIKDFPALEVNEEDCKEVIYDVEKLEKKEYHLKNAHRVWFDFETNVYTGDKHVPYLCYYVDESGESFGFRGADCGQQMLNHLHKRYAYLPTSKNSPEHSLFMIAHNASYDFTVGLIEHLYSVKTIEKGSMLMSASGTYYNNNKAINITVHDSYAKIPTKLSAFGKMFNLEQEKDVMCYPVYTTENIAKGWATMKECKATLKRKDHKTFVENCKKWGCLDGDRVDIIEYSSRYCEIDCIVLRAGYLKFSQMMNEVCGLNVDHYVSVASMADEYIIKSGCYDGCYSLGGVPRAFIQRCLVGGRTMLNQNKKQIEKNVQMADFDAVSLYPSAMNRLDGFLRGKPECIKTKDYNELCNVADGFYVRVRITGVGVNRSFPLLSYVNDEGIRIFSNDMIGRVLYIDDVALADAVQFQGVTFEIIDGYQFVDGFNNKIKSTITHLFNARLKAKKEKNPVQAVIKLIMNSCYGKTALKEIAEENKYVGKKDFEEYIVRHYNWIKEAVESHDGKRYRITKTKAINEHFNRVHIGIQILSMSKRIMNEVMCLAEDEGHEIYYQDTDSMHIYNEHVPLLADSFRKKYGRELIGKQMGQFHVDFELDGCKDIYSEKFIGLGKKSYIDCLIGTCEKTGEKKRGYHIRMKGVSNGAILAECKRRKITPYNLYEKMYNGESVTFDLLKTEDGDCVRFKKTKSSMMETLDKFERTVQF